jgi:hypothetical protein
MYDVTEDNCEHALYDSIITEMTDISGFPVEIYIPIRTFDPLYGEDASENLSDPVMTKLIYEPLEGLSITEAFGITSDETLQYAFIPKSTFTRDLSAAYYALAPSGTDVLVVPRPGLVIKTLWDNRNYEVVDVGKEQNIFLAKKLIYEFILRPFRFSEQSDTHREIHTGMDASTFETHVTSGGDALSDFIENEYGDNDFIETESNKIDKYQDIDEKMFGR